MSFQEWADRHHTEILVMRDFLDTAIHDDPVSRSEQMREAVRHLARAGTLAAEAHGLYRVALVNAWPEGPGSVELKKKQAEAASYREEVMADDLKRMVKALEHFLEICRTLHASDRAQHRGASLA